MQNKRIRLWDLPTRLFHWILLLAVAASVASGQVGGNWMDWHGRIGLLVVGLLAFRIVWGVLGSTYARFAQFFPTPGRLKAYLRGEWRGEGHNPLGALSVFGLLGLLTAQVTTGLFANDDIAFTGPLFDLVTKSLSNRLTGIHHLLTNVLYVLVALHVGAIMFYAHAKKKNLVRSMVTGWMDDGEGESARGGGFVAFIVALLVAVAVVYYTSGAWLPKPPPPVAVETPNF
ncbi:MAG TPA: cytochrome b/b6 domain-containing protein [Aestuariivirga sp.]|jgi:cytochrome b|nr:cytochrome b/b6 domain-containing protein [Aestuariivirga sp.]